MAVSTCFYLLFMANSRYVCGHLYDEKIRDSCNALEIEKWSLVSEKISVIPHGGIKHSERSVSWLFSLVYFTEEQLQRTGSWEPMAAYG